MSRTAPLTKFRRGALLKRCEQASSSAARAIASTCKRYGASSIGQNTSLFVMVLTTPPHRSSKSSSPKPSTSNARSPKSKTSANRCSSTNPWPRPLHDQVTGRSTHTPYISDSTPKLPPLATRGGRWSTSSTEGRSISSSHPDRLCRILAGSWGKVGTDLPCRKDYAGFAAGVHCMFASWRVKQKSKSTSAAYDLSVIVVL